MGGVGAQGAQQAGAPPAGGVQPSVNLFKMTRSISGSKGSVQGTRYVVEDPRTIFYAPEDRQVIVYVEWEGRAGKHKLEGLWKNPEGKMVVFQDFEYEAKDKKFAAYYTLVLGETPATGMWSLEARVNGEVTGTHSFQIVAAAKPEMTFAPPKRVPTPAEVYEEARAGAVWIEKVNAAGERFGLGTGFLMEERLLATAFHVIDGATELRIRYADGRTGTLEGVVAWNRRQDWALLRMKEASGQALRLAEKDSWKVGDIC